MNEEAREHLTVQGLIEELFEIEEEGYVRYLDYLSNDMYNYMKEIKEGVVRVDESVKPVAPEVTPNGIAIIKYMQTLEEGVSYTSKTLAEGMNLNSRSVSGGMRKLITGGYVFKEHTTPIRYTLTDKGWAFE